MRSDHNDNEDVPGFLSNDRFTRELLRGPNPQIVLPCRGDVNGMVRGPYQDQLDSDNIRFYSEMNEWLPIIAQQL
jgi:hypothetical protein